MELTPIGRVSRRDARFHIQIEPGWRAGLEGLEAFEHAHVLYWLHHLDTREARTTQRCRAPYRRGPEALGVFATRAPTRPNPIALTVVQLLGVDAATGRVELAWIDAADASPVLDLKPYVAALDRVARPAPPAWCRHWPASIEAAASFDWSAEITATP